MLFSYLDYNAMISRITFLRALKILILIVSLLISSNSFCQNNPDSSFIIKQGIRYVYDNAIYTKRQIREVIYSSQDPNVINLIDKAKGYNVAGTFLIIGGSAMALLGLYIQAAEEGFISIINLGTNNYESSNTGNIIAGLGVGFVGIGIIC